MRSLLVFALGLGLVCLSSLQVGPPEEKAVPTDKVNYAEHIAPLINKHCLECHRPGEVGPFSLIGYEQARKWAPMIALVAERQVMPPWKAADAHGVFEDENVLTRAQIQTLKNWDQAGAPRGNPNKEPRTPEFPSVWSLGEPDLILKSEQPFEIPADGPDEYRCFVLPTNYAETKWVKAMAVRPGTTKIVHHVIAYVDESNKSAVPLSRTKDGRAGYSAFGGPGFMPDGSFGGWAPGLRARSLPPGAAFELKPGAKIVMQVHYHKTGKKEMDQTQLGLYFAKEPITKKVELLWLANIGLVVPANHPNHRSTIKFNVSWDITMYGLMPHMHLLGKSFKATLELPDGQTKPLVFVPKWDFNWQLSYVLKQPIKIPKGSKVAIEAYYDNSGDNPNNPNNPPKMVRWGEETTDEMLLLVVAYSRD